MTHLEKLIAMEKRMKPGFKRRRKPKKKKKELIHPEVLRQKKMQKLRSCLTCGEMFMSAGPYNRQCRLCKHNASCKPAPMNTYSTPGSFDQDFVESW